MLIFVEVTDLMIQEAIFELTLSPGSISETSIIASFLPQLSMMSSLKSSGKSIASVKINSRIPLLSKRPILASSGLSPFFTSSSITSFRESRSLSKFLKASSDYKATGCCHLIVEFSLVFSTSFLLVSSATWLVSCLAWLLSSQLYVFVSSSYTISFGSSQAQSGSSVLI